MALTDLTRISTSGIATGSTIDAPILRKDVSFHGTQVGVTSALFDSSDDALEFNDNVKLKLGNSGDLELYHDPTGNSYIKETGGGSLVINADDFYLQNVATTTFLRTQATGSVEINFNGNKKFETSGSGAIVTGILTATSFSGGISGDTIGNVYAASGISTFYDLRVSNNLTVEGSTTTLDTNLIGVDRIEVGANSNSVVGVAITQSGTADILKLYDGSTEVVKFNQYGNLTITSGNPVYASTNSSSNVVTTLFSNSAGQGVVQTNSGSDLIFGTGGVEKVRITSNGRVGIGITNNVAADLQVRTGTNGNGIFRVGGTHQNVVGMDVTYSNSGATSTIFKQNYRSTHASALMEFDSGYFVFKTGTTGDETARIQSGKVGIGSDNPQETLHIHQDTGTATVLISSPTAPQIRINPSAADSSDNDRSNFGQATGSNNFVNGTAAGDTVLRGTSSGNIWFGHGTTGVVKITNSGNLEILNNNDYLKIGAGGNLAMVHTGGEAFITNATGHLTHRCDVHKWENEAGSAEYFRTDSSGNLLIGRTAWVDNHFDNGIYLAGGTQAGMKFMRTASGSAGTYDIGIDTDRAFKFVYAGDSGGTGATRFQIDSAGKIGVGQAPNTKFNVKLGVFAATGNDDASDWGADGIFQLDHSGSNAANNEVLLLGAVSGGVGQIASGFGFGRESTSNWGTYLSFKTHSTGTSNIDELIERLRIRASGQVQFSNGTFSDNVDCIMANGGTMEIGAQSTIKFRTATNNVLSLNSHGSIQHNSIGGSISYFKGSSEYIFGSNASAPNQGGNEANFQIHHGKSRATASINAFGNNAGGPILQFIASRSGTVGTLGTKCQSNDYLADLRFWGDNGTVNGTLAQGASIWVRAKSTPADGDTVIASEINFDTGSASAGSMNNVLKLRQDQQIEMTGARKVKINGVIEYYAAATMVNNTAYTFDFTVRNEGGYGNSYYIVVGYNHFHTSAYGAQRVAIVCTRGTALTINADIANVTHSQAGEWSFSKPNSTTLRITKSAGTYGGSGYGFIRMTGNGNTMG